MNWKREYQKVLADPEYFQTKYFLPLYPEIIGTLADRKVLFEENAFSTVGKHDLEIDVRDLYLFIEYWTALSKNGKQMKFEKEDVFHFPGRLRTWMQNKKKFNTVKILRSFGSQIRPNTRDRSK
jgi:hypothetical protein